jgi:hypothetical protein
MDKDQKALLYFLDMGLAVNGEHHCVRGLENQTKGGSWNVRLIHRTSVEAVLDEQDRQRELHINDPEAIARAYGRTTNRVRETALDRGLQDAKDAREKAPAVPVRGEEVTKQQRKSFRRPKKVDRKNSNNKKIARTQSDSCAVIESMMSSLAMTESISSLELSQDLTCIDVPEDVDGDEENTISSKKSKTVKKFLKKLRLKRKASLSCPRGQCSHAKATLGGAYDSCMF